MRTGWKKPAAGREKGRENKSVDTNKENKDIGCEIGNRAKNPTPNDT